MGFKNSLDIAHRIICESVKSGDTVIDATMGNGNDTLLLAKLVGEEGKVFAFDIQDLAIKNTKNKLEIAGLSERVNLINDGHENFDRYISGEISAIMYNLGYLPGGDHNIYTMPETTKASLLIGMKKLRVGGIISIVVYYGGDSGFVEKDDIMEFIKTIDNKKFSVLKCSWENQPNCPPIAIIIEKIK